MSVSHPSREIYVADVPEVQRLVGTFQYNFFTPDESVSESGGVPSQFLERSTTDIDASYMQYATTRAPRFVRFSWKLPRLADPGNMATDRAIRNNVFRSKAQNGSLISDNIDKVVTEDQFASNNFVGVTFIDGEIDDKMHHLVSGSFSQMTHNGQAHDHNVSHYKAANKLHSMGPKYIKPHFLFRALGQPSRASGTRFFGLNGRRVLDSYLERLKNVATGAQINSKLFHDITNRSIRDPHSPYTTDLHSIHKHTKKLKTKALQRSTPMVVEADYKTFVPFIDLKVRRTSHHHDHNGAEIVGYIIDKSETTRGGHVRYHSPIIIDNPQVHVTADFQVKYGSTYTYAIRTVALFNVPAVDDDTGDIAMLKVLISSRPTQVMVKTSENVAPPPPTDLNFTWDYERINPTTSDHDHETGRPIPGTGAAGSLMVHWTFPPNSQQDVKKFQLFRRKDIDHPFELIKMYDFDDSVLKYPDQEDPDPRYVEHLDSPASFFYDDDFHLATNRPSSAHFIYAVAAIDAHGLTSNYSAQYEIWFDRFENKLKKKLVSHSGAPKPYPNLYLEADTFVDTIKVSGPSSKRLTVYFNPEYYFLYDNNERLIRILATRQTGGKYRMQFINVDNQKSVNINIFINDMIRAAAKKISFPEIRFGAKRRNLTRKVISH